MKPTILHSGLKGERRPLFVALFIDTERAAELQNSVLGCTVGDEESHTLEAYTASCKARGGIEVARFEPREGEQVVIFQDGSNER